MSDQTEPAPEASGYVERPRRIIRRKRVKELAGEPSDTTLWRWVKNKTFPAPIQLNENSIGWFEDEILKWQKTRLRIGIEYLRGGVDPTKSKGGGRKKKKLEEEEQEAAE